MNGARIGAGSTGIYGLGLTGFPPLSETVGAFCRDMLRMRTELDEAHEEIVRLRQELAVRQGNPPDVAGNELRSLRRQISFHCHPDRGGDDKLMRRVNELFDHLEQSAEACKKVA